MFRNTCLVLACCLFAFSAGVNALGLGEIKLKSGLNQPLSAEIELFSAEGMSEFEVAAALASLVEFEKAGIDYFGYLRSLRFKTISREGERLVVQVTTRQPVKEPFLNFLVELNWPKGRMLREYTLLLDPPVFQESGTSRVQQVQSTPAASTRQTQPTSQPTYSASRQPLSPTQPAYSGNSYGPVGKNETLWRIATQVRPINASIHQTLVALYRANPQAFLNNDINLLKAGEVLAVPNAEDIAAIPRRAALQDMVARINGRNPGDTILDTSGRTTDSSQVVRGEDRLKLASPSSGSGVSGSGASGNVNRLKSQLAQSKEAAATLKAENVQLRRKLQDALGRLEDTEEQSGIAVDSTAGAILANQDDDASVFDNQDSNADESFDDDSAVAAIDDSNTSNPFDDDDDSSTSSDDIASSSGDIFSDDDSSTGDDSSASDTSADSSNSVSSSDSSINTVSSNNISTVSSNDQQSTSMFEDPLYIGGAAALVVVIGGSIFFFWRMRQRMGDDEFQDDLVSSAQGGNFDLDDSVDMPDVGDELLEDLSGGDSFESDVPAEADPLGEADIYIAYGKYDQAEKLLKEAIEENPSRTDLKVKLLECYAETKNRDAFDSVEAEYTKDFQADTVSAQEVENLRSQAWPGDNAPQDDFELPSTEEIFSEDDFSTGEDDEFSLDDLDTDSDVSIDDMMGDDSAGSDFDTSDMDFDIEENTSDSSSAETLVGNDADVLDDIDLDGDDFSLDGDLDDDILGSATDDLSTEDDLSIDGLDSDEIDLDMDDAAGGLSDDDDLSIDLDAGGDDLDIDLGEDFDLGDDDESLDDEFADSADEASTKLDLARAYIDMGDAEGAKEILNEVIEEGNDGHKTEALSLLEKI